MIRFRLAIALAMLTTLGSSARAEEPIQVVLQYVAPMGCSERETFASSLRARSPRIRVTESAQAAWTVNVRMTPTDRGVHGELRLTYGKGDFELRAVEGVDCPEVVEALSLTAALAIEQTVAQSSQEVPAPNSTGESAVDANSPASRPDRETSSRPGKVQAQSSQAPQGTPPPGRPNADTGELAGAARDSSRLFIAGFVAQRVHPQTSLGLAVSLLHTIPISERWLSEIGVDVFYVPSRALQPSSELSVGYYGVAIEGCPLMLSLGADFALSPCAVLDVSHLDVSDKRVALSTPSRRLTPSLGARLRSRMRLLPHVELGLEAGFVSPLVPRRYVTGPTLDSEGNEVVSNVGHTEAAGWQLGIGWLVGL